MQGYDAVVYDLDGTLVELHVDWDETAADVAAVLRARGIEVEGKTLWDLLQLAEQEGYGRKAEAAISEHEREGARTSTRLSLADELPLSVPTAVCSLNCEAACRIALELHGLDGYVDAIVGRDTVDTYKPDPKPLLVAIDALGADPREALFIGDSERDRETAQRAGVDFQWAAQRG